MVCLPTVKGTPQAKQLAMLIRANITRTFPKTPESEMGECSEFDPWHFDRKFQFDCPTDDITTSCVTFTNGGSCFGYIVTKYILL